MSDFIKRQVEKTIDKQRTETKEQYLEFLESEGAANPDLSHQELANRFFLEKLALLEALTYDMGRSHANLLKNHHQLCQLLDGMKIEYSKESDDDQA